MVENDIESLSEMSVSELQEMWKKYFRSEPIWYNKRFYIVKLAYRIQELAYGGLPNHIRDFLVNKTPKKRMKRVKGSNLPPVGTRIVRSYLGKEYNVVVTTAGFQFEEHFYKSLPAIALKITGKKISGNYFFGIKGKQNDN